MKSLKKLCLCAGVIALIDIGIEEIFHISFLDRWLVNLPAVSFIFHLTCLISGMMLLLTVFEKE